MSASFDLVMENCERFGAAIRRLGGTSPPLRVGAPATEGEIVEVEMRLGRKIPSALRSILVSHARSFSFQWERDHFHMLPHPWKHACEGRCLWSLDLLPLLNADLEAWRENVFPDAADRYQQHWHGVFAACATGLSDGSSASTDFDGGDFFAIKEHATDGQPVVFLSHDGFTPLNGRRLADDFDDFLLRWSAIGCVGGASGWGLEYFITDSRGGLDPAGEAAAKFRGFLGVQLA